MEINLSMVFICLLTLSLLIVSGFSWRDGDRVYSVFMGTIGSALLAMLVWGNYHDGRAYQVRVEEEYEKCMEEYELEEYCLLLHPVKYGLEEPEDD